MKRLLKALTGPRTHAYDSTLIQLGSEELIVNWLWCPYLSRDVAIALIEQLGLDSVRATETELQMKIWPNQEYWITVSTFRVSP